MKVVESADCANSPKNLFAQQVAVALFRKDEAALRQVLASDFLGGIAGSGAASPADRFIEAVPRLGNSATLQITTAITHGRAGAVEGALADSRRSIAFCLMLRFANAKASQVASIRLFLAEKA